MDRVHPTTAAPQSATVPHGWSDLEGLVCGFGDRFASAPATTLLLLRQVHGDRVVSAERCEVLAASDDGHRRLQEEADAVTVAEFGSIAGVRTADCVPLLLVSRQQRWAAVVHAGWRGTLAGIARRAVEHALAAGIAPSALHAALGPSIGPCCYEVSADLARQFAGHGHAILEGAPGSLPRLDLRTINSTILEQAGVPATQVQQCGPCTRCAVGRYHSFRAEPDAGGRQISWIGWEDRTRPPGR